MRVNNNAVLLSGSLGAEAEIGTSDGTAFARFSLSTTYRFRGSDGRERLGTTWIRIVAFGDVALSLRGLGMGSWLMVTGRLRQAVDVSSGGRFQHLEVVAVRIKVHQALPPGLEPAPAVEDGTLV